MTRISYPLDGVVGTYAAVEDISYFVTVGAAYVPVYWVVIPSIELVLEYERIDVPYCVR